MPRVEFHVLSEGAHDARLRYACRLAEENVEQGSKVYLLTASYSDTQRLDDLLWTWSDSSFLPHEIFTGAPASHERVMIMLGEQPAPLSHRSLLINLTESTPAELESYAHIVEIVDIDSERKRIARERFRHYRERGCALETKNV
jgi:DNA polymerase-3 subunit chi